MQLWNDSLDDHTIITRGSKSLKSVRWVAETRHNVDKKLKVTKGNSVQSDPLQFMAIILEKPYQKSVELQEELQRPDNWQKYIILATSLVGNDHLPENSPRVLNLVSLDASDHKEHEYVWFGGGDMNGIWDTRSLMKWREWGMPLGGSPVHVPGFV